MACSMTVGGEFVPGFPSGCLRGSSASVNPVAKWICSQALRNATVRNGRELLGKVLEDIPSKVKAVQIDGGSECEARASTSGPCPEGSPSSTDALSAETGRGDTSSTAAGSSTTRTS